MNPVPPDAVEASSAPPADLVPADWQLAPPDVVNRIDLYGCAVTAHEAGKLTSWHVGLSVDAEGVVTKTIVLPESERAFATCVEATLLGRTVGGHDVTWYYPILGVPSVGPPGCALGLGRPTSGTCCWPGQPFDASAHQCVGTPRCPNPFVASGSGGCTSPGEELLVAAWTAARSACLDDRPPPPGGARLLAHLGNGGEITVRSDSEVLRAVERCLERHLRHELVDVRVTPALTSWVWAAP